MNRSNAKGYWKATGKSREVHNDSQLIGMKKNLVFYSGRSPNGQRTNWVMHECRLIEAEYEKQGTGQEAYVLCRIFHKNNRGPLNGNRYAPFIEEEWDDGEATVVPGVDTVDEVAPVDDAYIERHNVEQDTPSIHMDPLSVNNGPTSETQNLLPVNNGPPRETKDLFPVNNEPPKETQNLLPVNNEPSRETRYLLPVNNEPSRETQNLLPVCKRERVEDVTPICVLNTQAPFRLLPYKRRHIDSSSNHSIASENSTRASTTMTAAAMATMASTSMASATAMPVSAMMEVSLMESLKLKESPNGRTLTLNTANLNPSVPPSPSDRTLTLNTANRKPSVPPSILKFINDLKEELHKVSVDRETLKLKMMSARATIDILQSRLDFLINENEILKRRIRDT